MVQNNTCSMMKFLNKFILLVGSVALEWKYEGQGNIFFLRLELKHLPTCLFMKYLLAICSSLATAVPTCVLTCDCSVPPCVSTCHYTHHTCVFTTPVLSETLPSPVCAAVSRWQSISGLLPLLPQAQWHSWDLIVLYLLSSLLSVVCYSQKLTDAPFFPSKISGNV